MSLIFRPFIQPLYLSDAEKKKLLITKYYDNTTSNEEKQRIYKMIQSTQLQYTAPNASDDIVTLEQKEQKEKKNQADLVLKELEQKESIKMKFVQVLNEFTKMSENYSNIFQQFHNYISLHPTRGRNLEQFLYQREVIHILT